MDDPLRKQYENNSARDGYGHYGSRDFPVEHEYTREDFADDWPVHIVVLQFIRDPDETDDPINWNWQRMLDDVAQGVEFVTGGVLGHADPNDYRS